MKNYLITILVAVSISQKLSAFPLKSQMPAPLFQSTAWVNFEESSFNWSGVVALSNCSGSLIRLDSRVSSPVYLLTNGHCAGFPKPGTSLKNKLKNARFTVFDNNHAPVSLVSDQIVYSTMTSTDLALMSVKATQEELTAKGVHVFDLDVNTPAANANINIPSGYHNRLYNCGMLGSAFKVMEAGWSFFGSYRYRDCNTIGGTSGSPIVDPVTNFVVGINNSANEDGAQCTMNNPCEIDENGVVTTYKGMKYGQRTQELSGCIDPAGSFDLNQSTCMLQK